MDSHIVVLLNHLWQGTRLDTFSQFVSRDFAMLGIRIVVIALAVIFKKKYWKKIILSFVLAAGLAYCIAEVGFKTALVEEIGIRPRPYVAYATEISPIGKQYSDSSFPSTHMMLTLAMITVLLILFPTLRPYAILYALIMARSRMHNGMHYPSDVLAWALIGIWCGWMAVALGKKIIKAKM